MQRERPGQVDVEEGTRPRRREVRGLFWKARGGVFHGCDWAGVTMEQFMDVLDAYLGWRRDVRAKSDLGHEGPMAHRTELGLVA